MRAVASPPLPQVPAPDRTGRLAVLRVHLGRLPLAPDVDLAALADATARFTGAEIEACCRDAALAALREAIDSGACHTDDHNNVGHADGGAPAMAVSAAAVVVSMRQLMQAVGRASPLLRNPTAAARFEGCFEGGTWRPSLGATSRGD